MGISNHKRYTSPQIDTDAANSTSPFKAAHLTRISCQLVFAAITGAQPVVKLQVSNDGTNWDDVAGVTHTTTAAAESVTKQLEGWSCEQYRWTVSTVSTTGTLDVRWNGIQ